jgi:hypothetical protein
MAKDDFGRLEQDIYVVRGDTKTQRIIVKTGAGAVKDITGYSGKLSVNPSNEPSDETEELFEVTGILTDAPNGVMDFVLSAANAKQPPETYYYDIQITTDTGVVCTLAAGKWVVGADITDPNLP